MKQREYRWSWKSHLNLVCSFFWILLAFTDIQIPRECVSHVDVRYRVSPHVGQSDHHQMYLFLFIVKLLFWIVYVFIKILTLMPCLFYWFNYFIMWNGVMRCSWICAGKYFFIPYSLNIHEVYSIALFNILFCDSFVQKWYTVLRYVKVLLTLSSRGIFFYAYIVQSKTMLLGNWITGPWSFVSTNLGRYSILFTTSCIQITRRHYSPHLFCLKYVLRVVEPYFIKGWCKWVWLCNKAVFH